MISFFKKFFIIPIVILLIFVTSCSSETPVIQVSLDYNRLTTINEETPFIEYITIYDDNEIIEVDNLIIDTSNINYDEEGIYSLVVTFTYNNKPYSFSFDIEINIGSNDNVLVVLKEDIEVYKGDVINYEDYISLLINDIEEDFSLLEVNDDLVNLNEVGIYKITVIYKHDGIEYSFEFDVKVIKEVVNISISTKNIVEVYQNTINFDLVPYLIIESNSETLSNDNAEVDYSLVNFNQLGTYICKVTYYYDDEIYYQDIEIRIIEKPEVLEETILKLNLNNDTYGKEESGIPVGYYSEGEVELYAANAFKTEETVGAIRIGSSSKGGSLFGYIDLPSPVNKIVLNLKQRPGSKDASNVEVYCEDSEGRVLIDKRDTPTANYKDHVFFMQNNTETRIYFEVANGDYERFLLNEITFIYSKLNQLTDLEKTKITESFNKDYSNITIKENFTGNEFYYSGNVMKSFGLINNVRYPIYVIKGSSKHYFYDEDGYKSEIKSWEIDELMPTFRFNTLDSSNVYKEENGYTIYDKDIPGSMMLYVTSVKNLIVISMTFTINSNGYIDSIKVYTRLNNKHYSGVFNFSNIGSTVVSDYPTY